MINQFYLNKKNNYNTPLLQRINGQKCIHLDPDYFPRILIINVYAVVQIMHNPYNCWLYCFEYLYLSLVINNRVKMIAFLTQRFGGERMSYIYFGLSQVMFPLAFIYANDNKMHTIQTSLIRGIISVLYNYAIIRYYDMGVDYKYDTNFYNIFKRNLIVVIHGLAITAAQFYLPLPIVHTVNFFAPIFIFVIDYFENGVKINKTQLYFLIFSILGVLCTINNELVQNFVNSDYQIQTNFKNYIKLTPGQFSLYGFALIGIMFLWAYGLLRVRTYYKNHHTYVNFHLGLLFTITSGILYPSQVAQKTDIYTLLMSIFWTGLPLAIGQSFTVVGLGLNKKSGQLVILTGIPVFVGYLVSYFRYGEMIQFLELIGSIMIFIGLVGVINCGQPHPQSAQLPNRLIGDPAKPPAEMYYSILRLG